MLQITATTLVVNVYAIVQDRKGNRAQDLSKQDFELKEDGVPQQIDYFSHEVDVPLSLGIVIDTSPSQERMLATEQQEAKVFVRSVLGPADQAFVMGFDLDVELLQSFTGDVALLAGAIDKARVNTGGRSLLPDAAPGPVAGGTHLYDAVYLASNELMKSEVGRKVVVLVTDGEDQGSRVKREQALEAAERADVIVYSVAVSDPLFYWAQGKSFKGDSALAWLSKETGGSMIPVNGTHDTAAAFREIAAELRAQYRLAYAPGNSRRDGSFRKIQLRVRQGAYKVRARQGYYALAE